MLSICLEMLLFKLFVQHRLTLHPLYSHTMYSVSKTSRYNSIKIFLSQFTNLLGFDECGLFLLNNENYAKGCKGYFLCKIFFFQRVQIERNLSQQNQFPPICFIDFRYSISERGDVFDQNKFDFVLVFLF